MKRVSRILMLVIGFAITFSACEEDEGPTGDLPSISEITPDTGSPGTAVTIKGSNFGTSPTVKFGSTTATVTGTPTATSIETTVPDGLASGEVDVTVTANGNTTAAAKFSVESSIITVTDADLTTETYEWTKDKTYMVDGLVYLEEGGVLNIEEGTVIKFVEVPSNGSDNTSALFITKGAKIMAEGTVDEPIIFTAEEDDLNGNLTATDNELWGGLVLLGKAPAFKGGVSDAIQIEGIDSEESRGQYGGSDPEDNSGILKYVSIRFTGIGFQSGDELQGLTLGGVGRGTTIDYIDIFSSADDGIEIFGGTVNIKHVSVAFSTDDDFDFDLGWRGNGQFLFSLMGDDGVGFDHTGEWDGASPDDADLFSAPNIYNLTSIGPGQSGTSSDKAILMRESFAGKLGNSIFEDFPFQAIEVQDLSGDGRDSYDILVNGADGNQIEVANNTWAQFGSYDAEKGMESLVKASIEEDDQGNVTYTGEITETVKELEDNNNTYSADAVLMGISREANGGLDPRPTGDVSSVAAYPNDWFESVNYRGAFAAEGPTWLSGWSTLAKYGYLSE